MNAGQIVRFTYDLTKPKLGHDRFKEVLVLHPGMDGKMHGIDLKRLNMAERIVLRDVFDRNIVAAVRSGKPHRLPLVNDIIKRMDPPSAVNNHMTFYTQFVKPFIRGKDVYRTYYVMKIRGMSVIPVTSRPVTPAKKGI